MDTTTTMVVHVEFSQQQLEYFLEVDSEEGLTHDLLCAFLVRRFHEASEYMQHHIADAIRIISEINRGELGFPVVNKNNLRMTTRFALINHVMQPMQIRVVFTKSIYE